MTDYTVGFMFNKAHDQVVLIEKDRPDWQKGKLNGVGGHINENETARQGMVREFNEEAGVSTEEEEWQCFCRMQSTKTLGMVYFFTATNELAFRHAKTMESEKIHRAHVACINGEQAHMKTLDSLKWLIPLALYGGLKFPVSVVE